VLTLVVEAVLGDDLEQSHPHSHAVLEVLDLESGLGLSQQGRTQHQLLVLVVLCLLQTYRTGLVQPNGLTAYTYVYLFSDGENELITRGLDSSCCTVQPAYLMLMTCSV